MTRYGKSPWLDRCPPSRVPTYGRQRGPLTTDVLIIGGGLAGCAAAYAFAAAGVQVTLVEADRIGGGITAAAGGWLSSEPGVSFVDLERERGVRAARQAFQAWRKAAVDFAALLRKLHISCGLDAAPMVTVAATPEQAARLKKEQQARRAAGVETPVVAARAVRDALGVDAPFAIRDSAASVVDPYRAALGLAQAAAARGATIYERTAARRVTFNRKIADVFTAAGAIRARRVVVATGVPTTLYRQLQRHFWFRSSYLVLTERVPASVRKTLGRREQVLRDSSEPRHVVRWVDDERLLVSGADLQDPPERQRERIAVQRTGQLMYELSTIYPEISGLQAEYGWDAPYARSGDGLPYFGPHRNLPHHLFAWGDASGSVTGAYLASRILLRYHLDEPDAADEPFAFTRNER